MIRIMTVISRILFFSYEWRDYVDNPQSEPAYALITIENQELLLIGDRKDPIGMIRRMYRLTDDDVVCAAISGQDETWCLLSDGTFVRKEELTGQENLMPVEWLRFWESRKAIVASEDTGGLVSRNGLGEGSYTLGKEQTGLVTKARKILELPVGTEVDVYSSENGWTEIEWNRWHGYVKNDFLK